MKRLAEYKNGNHITQIYEDGTRVRETINPNDDYFTYDFPENFDICITKYCDAGCPYCHEGATTCGKHGDIMNLKFIDTLTPGTEVAVGGGNALDHPDLVPFLEKLKKQGVLANMTINQVHIKKNEKLIKDLINKKLINGIGVSLVNSEDEETFKIIDELGDNVVIQVIAGILKPEDIKIIEGRKVLILGYKTLRRGETFAESAGDEIKSNIEWLKKDLPSLNKKFKVLSFDCLAIKQLDVQNTLSISDKVWNRLFQGDDYSNQASTLYIDVPNMKVARSSTQEFDKRKTFSNESISDLFKMTMEGI